MKFKKTPIEKRGTYRLYDDDNRLVSEYLPEQDGTTEVDIINLHKIDDHEVYVNCTEIKLPEWFQPVYDEWKARYIDTFKAKHGRIPYPDEITGGHRVYESIESQFDFDEDESTESSHLASELAVYDEEDLTDDIIRLREIISGMPQRWQDVYQLVFIDGNSNSETGRILGISETRVRYLAGEIKKKIENDEFLKNFYKRGSN